MKFIDFEKLSDYEMDFLFRFRYSKTLDTLDRQCERMELTHRGDAKALDAINTAWCVREQELLSIGAPVFKGGNLRMSA